MFLDTLPGRPRRANTAAALAATGRPHPGGRPPLGGAFQQMQAATSLPPGCRPLSAQQVAAVNAQNSRIKREVEQTARECQREITASNRQLVRQAQRLSAAQYDFDKHAQHSERVEMQLPGTWQQVDARRYRAGELWIYATELHNGWGDHQYFVYNPQTRVLVHVQPALTRQAAIQGTALATGKAGIALQITYGGLALGGLSGAVAVEAGGYYVLTEQVAPWIADTAVTAYRIGSAAARTYGKKLVAEGVWAPIIRMGVDVTSQFITGYWGAIPDEKHSRFGQAADGINGTAVIAAGLVSTNGISKVAKLLTAAGVATTTNLITVSGGNMDKYQGYWHMVDFSDTGQSIEYIRNVILGIAFDQGKEYGADWVAKRAAALAEARLARPVAKLSRRALSWVSEKYIALPANFTLGVLLETPKKWWENQQAAQEQQAKEAKAQKKITSH